MAVRKRLCERCLKVFYGDSRFCEQCIERMETLERAKRFEKGLYIALTATVVIGLLLIWFWFGLEASREPSLEYFLALLSVWITVVAGLVSLVVRHFKAGNS
jgi:hypothetical protein